VDGALGKGSKPQYLSRVRAFKRWCEEEGGNFLPTDVATLKRHAEVHGPQRGFGGLLSALRWYHDMTGHEFPEDTHKELRQLAQRGRRHGPMKELPHPLTASIVRQWIGRMPVPAPDWAEMTASLCTLSLRCGLRPGETAAARIRDVDWCDGYMTFTVVDGKTDGEKRIQPKTYIKELPGEAICSVHWTRRWLKRRTAGGAKKDDHLYTGSGKPKGGPLKVEEVGKIYAEVAKQAGSNKYYTGKSARRGMATTLAASGFSAPVLMAAGRWTSEQMPKRYIDEWAPTLAGAEEAFQRSAWEGFRGARTSVRLPGWRGGLTSFLGSP